jgi:hypothetical protein
MANTFYPGGHMYICMSLFLPDGKYYWRAYKNIRIFNASSNLLKNPSIFFVFFQLSKPVRPATTASVVVVNSAVVGLVPAAHIHTYVDVST